MSDKKVFLRYKGPYDERILAAKDLATVGVDEGFNLTRFYKDRASAVTEDVAIAILSNPELFGNFEQVEKTLKAADEKVESSDSATKDAKPASQAKPKNQ